MPKNRKISTQITGTVVSVSLIGFALSAYNSPQMKAIDESYSAQIANKDVAAVKLVRAAKMSTAGDQMGKVTQQKAAMVEETTAAAQSSSRETEELAGLTERFRTKDADRGAGAASQAATPAARLSTPAAHRPAAAPVPPMKHTGSSGAAPRTGEDDWEEFQMFAPVMARTSRENGRTRHGPGFGMGAPRR